jgi:hypothetical protein
VIDIFTSEDMEIFHCVFSASHSLLYNKTLQVLPKRWNAVSVYQNYKTNSGSILAWSPSASLFGIDWRPWPTSQTFSFLCCRQFSNQFAAHLSLYFVGLGTVSPSNLGLNFNVWNLHCEVILYHWFLFLNVDIQNWCVSSPSWPCLPKAQSSPSIKLGSCRTNTHFFFLVFWQNRSTNCRKKSPAMQCNFAIYQTSKMYSFIKFPKARVTVSKQRV